jgi:oxygen-independent coproporphyrinogen-3 oxidase
MKELRIYIHIPFCRQRCAYCDFVTYDDKSYLIDSYFKALETEIALYAPQINNSKITSIFFGGGTPSYPEAKYIKGALNKFKFTGETEISIEANPGTVDYDKLAEFREAGINRISFGVQSFDNDMLLIMGRIHDRALAIRNIKDALKAGFDNISIDLMHGYPLQSEEGFRDSLKTAVDLGISHISCYSLKVGEGTPLQGMLDKGLLPEPDDKSDRNMYRAALGYLSAQGFKHYEISNFAKPGKECKHNIGYWVLDEYLGIGAGAHSYYKDRRFSNTGDLGKYIRNLNEYKIPEEYSEAIDEIESAREFMILGLRMIDGISTEDFLDKYNKDIFSVFGNEINECIDAGLLAAEGKMLKLTSRGLNFANKVFRKFI